MFAIAVLLYFLFLACGAGAQEPLEETGFEPLAALYSYAGTQQPGSVTLVWNAVDDPTVQGYRLHLGLNSGRYIFRGRVGNVTSFTMSLPRGFTWYFAVTAYNAAGESLYSDEVVTTVPLF